MSTQQSAEQPYTHDPLIYDHFPPYARRQDLLFYRDQARRSAGPVLELGCGTGRVSIPVARELIETVGLDADPAMLDRARAKLANEDSAVQDLLSLHQGDMRSFHLDRTFNLVTTPFRSFQHLLSVEDQLACLRCAYDHLAPQGRFVLDVFNPSIPHLADDSRTAEQPDSEPFTLPDGRRVQRSSRVLARNHFTQVQTIELFFDITRPDGRTQRHSERHHLRHLFRYEAEHLLARAGFAVEQVLADYDRSPFGSREPGELILIARKD